MRERSKALVVLLIASFGSGCATASPGVYGRAVKVTAIPEAKELKGELLAVDSERVWVREEGGVREVPLQSVRRIDVRRHGLDGQKAWKWAIIGAVTTGLSLSLSCSSVEGNSGCGTVGLIVGASWLGFGALSAASLEKSSRMRFAQPTVEELRGFARFPQGLPQGLDPLTLNRKEAKDEP